MLCFECYPKKNKKALAGLQNTFVHLTITIIAGDKSHELTRTKKKSALMVAMNYYRFTLVTSGLQKDRNKLNNFKYVHLSGMKKMTI